MRLPVSKQRSFEPDLDLQALGDWLDSRAMEGMAHAVRDFMPLRDGAWRPYAQYLIGFLKELPKHDARRAAIPLLRTPKSRLRETVKLSQHI